MKVVIVLLTTAAALACGVPHHNLRSIINAVVCLHNETLNTKFDKVFVKNLKRSKIDRCEMEFFCQAEKVLSEQEKLFDKDECNVNKLVRNLKQFSIQSNCTVPTKGDEIILHTFLDDLKKCAKMHMFMMTRAQLSK
ncbi:hypothetical protein AMELA_G00211390 [Ameiurus melas]|uniref:Interleukin-4 n=1 Tax=Ameiurus melas TaxID=219545 RepID=A0A7J6A4N6_AMEME|nr:hypothetical protein AMELA_G00211390 [Ameiurus melas]